MLVTDQKSLCLKCHAKQGTELAAAKSVHAAFETGDCSKCHSPHKASLKTLLLGTSPDLCLSCHKKMKDKIASETAHRPVDDCLSCHKPHGSPEARLVSQPVNELCGQCHDGGDKSFAEHHLSIDPQKMRCISCHNPHSSKDPKFFKATVHAPFAARQCDACHEADKR
jgi:predicted CXXCH cytochrome family protein